ncbi:T9SS type A sorting domain-containing protein [bacterium]|nr:T9SS type A sorting domain-containing protein [bacterium]
MRFLTVAFILLAVMLAGAGEALVSESLVLVGPISREAIATLERDWPLSIDDYDGSFATCYTFQEKLELLDSMPWGCTVLVEDLQAHYAEQRAMDFAGDKDEPWTSFHTYAETMTLLETWANDNSSIAKIVDVGTSVEGRHLRCIVISDNVATEEYEPEVRVIGTIHGNEEIANEVVLYLAERLLTDYGTDSAVTEMVDGMEIWLQPLVNPDGYVASRRSNNNSVDLNRNLSYHWNGSDYEPHPFSQPETKALADYSGGDEQYVPDNVEDNTFVLGLTHHSGAVCLNYVWNYQYTDAADKAHVWHNLCQDYSDGCEDSSYYSNLDGGYDNYGDGYQWYDYMDAICEGAEWYPTHGDVNDWSYGERGCLDTTVELSDGQGGGFPEGDIIDFCDANYYGQMAYLEYADDGLHGTVKDGAGVPVLCTITVDSRTEAFMYNDPTVIGDYWLPLDDGTYDVTFSADGYTPQTFEDVVVTGDTTTPIDVVFSQSGVGDLTISAHQTSDGVLLSWETSAEFIAYNIYRDNGRGNSVGERLNQFRLDGGAACYLDARPHAPVSRYRIEAITPDGHREVYGPAEVRLDGEATELLVGLYPNPVVSELTLELNSGGSDCRVTLYDLSGRLVDNLYSGSLSEGRHSLSFDLASRPAGVYLLRVESGSVSENRRVVITR